MNKTLKYKRIDRWFLPAVNSHSIHLGDDHLVTVQAAGLVYQIHRIFFSEVQALSCQRTRAYSLIALLLLGLALVCATLVGVGMERPSPYGEILVLLGSVVGIPAAVALLLHLLGGPTCETRLYTAAASYRLRSLNRLWRARRALARIQTQIEVSQGVLPATALLQAPPEDDPAAETRVLPVTLAAAEVDPPSSTAELELTPGRTRAHDLLFLLMLLMAASLFLDYFQQSSLKNLFDSMLHLGIVGVAVWAAARQRRMILPAYLRYYTMGILGMLIVLQYVQGFSVFTFFLGNPAFVGDPAYAEIFMDGQLPEGLEFLLTLQIVLFGGTGMIGLLLTVLYSMSQSFRRGTAEP
jgi:hypothetical protein